MSGFLRLLSGWEKLFDFYDFTFSVLDGFLRLLSGWEKLFDFYDFTLLFCMVFCVS